MAEPLLVLDGVRAGYGDSVVLEGISLEVAEQGSLAVLGRNGGGKKVASGVYLARVTVNDGDEKFFKMAVIK